MNQKLGIREWVSRLFNDHEEVFFVQMGSNDGKSGDPFFPIASQNKNWRGVLVEPVPEIFESLQKNYNNSKRFRYVPMAISNQDGERPFYTVNLTPNAARTMGIPQWYSQLGSFEKSHIEKHLNGKLSEYIHEAKVKVSTLKSLIKENEIDKIDVFHVDAEGADWMILQQFDLEKFHPRLIVFERKHLNDLDEASAKARLQQFGYQVFDCNGDVIGVEPATLSKMENEHPQRKLDYHIRFVGMKRHGNHGVINWLLSQLHGRITFRNNAGKFENMDLTRCDNIEALKQESRTEVDLDAECDKKAFLVSYEDKRPDRVFDPNVAARYESWINHRIGRNIHVIILRDPFNYFGSRLKGEMNGDFKQDWRFSDEQGTEKLIDLWKQYARWFLRFEESDSSEEVAINYNRWVISKDYRDTICDQIGLQNSFDEAKNVVSGWGGGSSFDGRKLQTSEKYLERWKFFSGHPVLKRLYEDDEILAQTARIFGDVFDFDQIRDCLETK